MAEAKTVSLTVPEHRACAEILVSQGLNCFRLKLESDGREKEVIWAEAGFGKGESRASSGGMPILFPFAGRIQRGRFQWDGQAYELPNNDGRGNAIHGFAYTRPWKIVEQQASELTACFRSDDDPQLASLWPAKHQITVTYRLMPSMFQIAIEVKNIDNKPLPYSLGLHPYFTTPDQEATTLTAPVSQQWALDDLIPTGDHADNEQTLQLRAGAPVADLDLDDVFSGTEAGEAGTSAWLSSPATRDNPRSTEVVYDSLEVKWSPNFPACVLYTPGNRESICVEPYSALPDMFAMTQANCEPGVCVLAPGETEAYWCNIELTTNSQPS